MTLHAIKSGYRHVDSAVGYRNEKPTVAGMLKAGVPREQLFFTSKVPPREINYESAKRCVDETLKVTGLDYIDLYLLHAPYGGKENRLGAWKGLVETVKEGKVRSIGEAVLNLMLPRADKCCRCLELRCASPRRTRAMAEGLSSCYTICMTES